MKWSLAVAVTASLFETRIVSADNAADVAVYNAVLAAVKPGQTTVEMGDMIVPVTKVKAWRDALMGVRAASQTNVDQWPGGVVYYAFNANVTAEEQVLFAEACEEWAMFANLTFTPRTAEPNYIRVNEVASLEGGSSAVGMIGGRQELNVGPEAWNRYVLTHEIGHALGLIHEHQRSDRDTYVSVTTGNIAFGWSAQFTRIPTSTHFKPYDFLSIMHYGRDAFTDTPGQDTITCRTGYEQYQNVMGRFPTDRWLSRGDRESIATMYGPGPALSTVVTNTKDGGPGSLRAALYRAFDVVTDDPQARPVITFEIPLTDPGYSDGVFTIRPSGKLPGPGPGVTVDGTTQTAFTGDTNPAGPEVVLSGARSVAPEFTHAFILGDNGAVVRGLVIQGFTDMGIVLTGQNNRVEGCYIGTNAAGTAAVPNGTSGVDLREGATGNVIGGDTAAERNVISGNTRQGVAVSGSGSNVIKGNYVGTNAAGTGALANGWTGVALFNASTNNTVGPGNVLSGNGDQGIVIAGAGTTGNEVKGNVIGLNAAGTAALGNTLAGVQMQQGAQGNVIGGAGAGEGNVISGNVAQGVVCTGAGTEGNVVRGNKLGTNATGTAALPNGGAGAAMFSLAARNTVGPNNVISGNATYGVVISDAGTAENTVTGNVIGLNAAGTAVLGNMLSGVAVQIGAANNTVGPGNVISGNGAQGVVFTGAGSDGNKLRGNVIGLNAAGMAAVPNVFSGVEVSAGAKNSIIGGEGAAGRNVISGNTRNGVVMSAGATGTVVEGNYIGTNAAGTGAAANGQAGVVIQSGSTSNIVGPGNVISGNTNQGVLVTGAGTGGNVVRENFIGTNAAGMAALANGVTGVTVAAAASGNTVGPNNVISGNTNQGVLLSEAGTTGNKVTGNVIGLNAVRSAAVPNLFAGVAVNSGAQGNTLGGAAAGEGNVISGNATHGVSIGGTNTKNNVVRGNLIGTNATGTGAMGNAWTGVFIFGAATNNTVGPGNLISGNLSQGVLISDAGTNGNAVRGNAIGVNAAGTAALPNAFAGVQINLGAQENTIGGLLAGEGNIISGNTLQGVAINGTNTSGNLVRRNFIGTNLAGTAAIPNVTTGLEIYGGAAANVVGGAAGAGNVISGNSVRGISVSGPGTNGNVVAGNLIGLNAAGTAALANAGPGVAVFNTAQNTVIGGEAGGRNFIAGNNNSGIRISGAGANGTRIIGNSIGVTPGGAVAANTGDGVEVFGGPAGTVIGGSTPGAGNLIRGNTRDGVGVYDAATVVMVQGNSIYGNGGEGIDLAGNGVTANDSNDADTGPNGLQNFPVLTSAVLGAGTTLAGTLSTTANSAVRIDYYASATGDEGQYFIGSQNGTTNASGNLAINTTLAARVPAGYVITATATGAANNTSEFSAARAVTVTDSDGDGMPDAWEAANGLAPGSNDAAPDADGDGESNLAEFRAGTDPRNGASVLDANLTPGSGGAMNVGFPGVAGVTYRVDFSSLLTPNSWLILADQIHATGGPMVIPDAGAAGAGRRFYRVTVLP